MDQCEKTSILPSTEAIVLRLYVDVILGLQTCTCCGGRGEDYFIFRPIEAKTVEFSKILLRHSVFLRIAPYFSSLIDHSTHVFPIPLHQSAIHISLSAANISLIVAFSLCIAQPFLLAGFSHKSVDHHHSQTSCNSLLNSFRITL